jgi:uncharacterized OB-fold protein
MVKKMTERVPIGYKCVNCGKIHYPAHGRCLKCKYQEFEDVELPSEGILLSYTMLKAPPSGIDKFALYLGIIDLGEVRMTGQIEVSKPEKLQIGIKLQSKWQKVRVIDNIPNYGFVWTSPDINPVVAKK